MFPRPCLQNQEFHSDGRGRIAGHRLFSSFVALQDTTTAHGPTEVIVDEGYAKRVVMHIIEEAKKVVWKQRGSERTSFPGESHIHNSSVPLEKRVLAALNMDTDGIYTGRRESVFRDEKRAHVQAVLNLVFEGEKEDMEMALALATKYVFRSRRSNLLYFKWGRSVHRARYPGDGRSRPNRSTREEHAGGRRRARSLNVDSWTLRPCFQGALDTR